MPEKRDAAGSDGLLTQVCLECGKEYTFESDAPAGLTCDRCGNNVFRSFFSPLGGNEAQDDFRETTERDVAPNDDPGEVTKSDILDLNNL